MKTMNQALNGYNRFRLWQRVSALMLAVLMIFGILPYAHITYAADSGKAVDGGITTVADPETLTRPELIYGDNTINAGKVTVGKSVSNSDITVNGQNISLDGDNNFLVTISQSAQVMGLSSEINLPLDVVIAFDTSGSMGNDSNGNGKNRTQELVEAANKMISSLMEMNDLNRVGVVAFSAHNAGGGTAGYDAANVLSELAHYDGESATNHLTWTTGRGPSWAPTVQLVQGRSTTNGVRNSRYGTGGATNIQAGITLGSQLLMEADTTVTINNQTLTRVPIMILMSDGAPTVSAYENQWWNASQTNNQGPTNAPFMGNGFLAVLTASYYKDAITNHYFGENATNACAFYTVGVELSDNATQDTVQEVDLSYMTLNPSEEFVSGSDNYYYDNNDSADSFLDAWTSYQKNEEFKVRVWSGQTRHDGYYYFYNTSHTLSNANDHKNGPDSWTTVGRTTVRANILDSVTSLHYNDKFYNVTDVSKLTEALDDMLTEIARKAITVPTKVSTGDHDFDGYVTFTDPIGEYMEVKDMKGVVAGGYFYQGESFAKYLQSYNTANANSEFDALLRRVIKTRMQLSAADDRFESEEALDKFIDNLLISARDSANQANYSQNGFDNSFVWWGNAYNSGGEDEQVQLVDFADNDTIEFIEAQKAAGTIPAGADYVCRSYFFYGEAGGANPDPDHEYLYFMVRVQRELTAPYNQTVVISAPASLLSMEKVLITETFDENGNPVYTATVEHQEPARVVYEVGLWDHINSENVSSIVSKEYASEKVNGTGSVNYDSATDTYNFFTNDWNRGEALDSHHRPMAKATFDAAADNAFYTYQQDTLLVDAKGNALTSDPAGTTAYYVREYFQWNADNNADGTYSAVKKTQLIEVDIPADTKLTQADGKWYIPKGAYTAATLVVNGDDTLKESNLTGTSSIVAHPHRTGDASNSHYAVLLGNNGMLSLKSNPYTPKKTVSLNLPDNAIEILDDNGKAVKVGDVLTYTVEAKNIFSEAVDMTITDYIPAGTAFVENSAGSGKSETGHTVDTSIKPDSNNVLTWILKNVPAGETRYVSFRVTVTEAALSLNVVSNTINNTAQVRLNNNSAVYTNTTHNPPYGKTVTDVNNQNIDGDHGFKVGDTLVYHIRFHNNAVNSDGVYVNADVKVTDKLPEGTTFVSADNGGVYNESDGVITWNFADMAANTSKTVSFRVTINASAKVNAQGTQPESGEIYFPNTATIIIDNDPEITITTNTTQNWADVGDMVIRKIVAQGGDDTKTFTILLSETTGMLDGEYALDGSSSADTVRFAAGKAAVSIKHGETLTIKGLPAGAIINIAEDISALPGWTPTYNTRSVTIVKGAATTVSSVSVTNTYNLTPLTLTIKGNKVMNGILPEAATFGFIAMPDRLNPVAGDPLTGEVNVKASGTYEFSFSPKTFTQPGLYRYAISEISGGVKGVTYDTTNYMLAVNVIDNGDGTMSAEAMLNNQTFDLDSDAVTFTNTYIPDDVPLTLVAQKAFKVYDVVTGAYVDINPENGRFRFQIVEKDNSKVVTTGANSSDGTITFNTFYFSYEMLEGVSPDEQGNRTKTFTFAVSEVVPEIAKDPNMLYDLSSIEFEATLTYSAQGILSVSVNGDSDGYVDLTDSIEFVNYSNPDSVSVTPVGAKTTANAPDGITFSFAVINTENGNEAAAGVGDANGNITFSALTYNQVGTYTYWIKESNAGNTTNGITYDATRYLMRVVVSRDNYNRLVADVSYWASDVDGSENINDYTNSVNLPSFHNEYNAGGFINITATKVLSGRDLNAGEFAFKLIRQDNNGEIDGIVDSNGTINFSTLYYSVKDIPAGSDSAVIHYVMSEVIPATAKLPGVTYDTNTYDVYIQITDNNDGTISAQLVAPDDSGDYITVNGSDTGIVFNNSYKAVNGDEIKLQIKKTLNGREMREGEFDFQLFHEGSTVPVDIATNDGNGIVTLSRKYPATVAPGTYTYIIKEAVGTLSGMTYDTATYTINVRITDDGNGNIIAELVDGNGNVIPENQEGIVDLTNEIEFVNTYVPGDVLVQLEATKELTGRDMNDREFSFIVRENDIFGEIVATGSNDVNGNINFSTFDITAQDMNGATEKTFTYVVLESNNNIPGVTIDTTIYTVTATVRDDGNGRLVATVNYPDGGEIVFNNIYTPADVEMPLTAFKTLIGKNLKDNEFTFELKDANGNTLQSVTNIGGVVNFENLVFTADDMVDEKGNKVMTKTFVYTITEVEGNVEGMVYDSNAYTITVTVTDDSKGNLSVSYNVSDNNGAVESISFTNSYNPPAIQVEINGTKSIVDVDGNVLIGENYDLSGFEFEVYDLDGNFITSARSDSLGNIKFTGFEFASAGEYRFLIKEKTTDRAGYSTDSTIWCVHITIGYDADKGELFQVGEYVHIAPESHDEIMALISEDLTFVNVYNPADVTVELTALKELSGRELHDHEFSFYMINKATGLREAESRNHADGHVHFLLTYNNAGVYSYTICEEIPANGLGGVTYSEERYDITITVTDDGSGALKATIGDIEIIGSGEADLTDSVIFRNFYNPASVDVTLEAFKRLDGKALTEGIFTFNLVNNDDSSEIYSATNDVNGRILFQTLTFDKAGVYTYTLTEEIGNAGGVTYDTASYTVTITVTDGKDGKLYAQVHYSIGDEVTEAIPVFHNSYKADKVGVQISADKNLANKVMVGGEFSFELKDENGNILQATNDAEGNILFDTIEYTEVGTYKYTLYEVAGDIDGITYDDTVYTITVTVTDDGNGYLNAEVEYSAEELVFNNSYKADKVEVQISADKNLANKEMVGGEFSFELKDENGNILQATNDAEGNILFDTIEYTEVGRYEYTLYEVAGNIDGITYDETVYTITVTVTDDGNGYLNAEVEYSAEELVFNNSYKADKVEVQISADKNLANKVMVGGEFSFELKDENGNILHATNDAEGNIVFDTIEYTEVGRYEYTLYEVAGDIDGITYDDTVYTITVTVTDDGNGKLAAKVQHNGESLVFNNVYEIPSTPDTGDFTSNIQWFVLMISSVAVLMFLKGNRREQRI